MGTVIGESHDSIDHADRWELWLRVMVPEAYDTPELRLEPLSLVERRSLYCSLSGHFATTGAIADFLELGGSSVRMAITRGRSKIANAH